jgi:hypothetical protein
VGPVQDSGGPENLNRSAGSTQPKREIVILGWKERSQPPMHILKRLTRNYQGARAVSERSIPSQVIAIVDHCDFLWRISWFNGRQRSFEPRHGAKNHLGLLCLHDPLVNVQSPREKSVIAVKKYQVVTGCEGGATVASGASALIGFKTNQLNSVAILLQNLLAGVGGSVVYHYDFKSCALLRQRGIHRILYEVPLIVERDDDAEPRRGRARFWFRSVQLTTYALAIRSATKSQNGPTIVI